VRDSVQQLAEVGIGVDLAAARGRAYAAADRIRFDGIQRREDIALREVTTSNVQGA